MAGKNKKTTEEVASEENGVAPGSILEALLFSSEEPLTASKLKDAAPELADEDVRKLVKQLNKHYEQNGRAFRVRSIAGGYQLFTEQSYDVYVQRLYTKRQQNRLSTKALETLAIIAYKQPVTRHEIEEVRGVSADGVLRTLLSRNLITISGTATTPGNPYLYRTTKQFLEHFGLANIKQLPRLKELDEIVKADAELQETVDEELLKELASEKLGLAEDGTESTEENNTEQEPEAATEQRPDDAP